MAKRSRQAQYSVKQLGTDLEAGRIAPAYLVVGEEEGLRERARHALEALVPEDARGMDLEVLDGGSAEIDWSVVAGAARTLPWMGGRRVVLVEDCDALDGEPDDFLRYLDDPSGRVVVGLLTRKVDRRTNPWKTLGKLCTLVACDPLDEQQLRAEAREIFRRKGLSIANEAAARVLEMVGPDLQRLESETEKLALFAGGEGSIELETVEALLGRSRERAVWDFTDALARRDREAALKILAEMIEDGASEHYLVAMAAWNTRRLLTGKDIIAEGGTQHQAAKEVKAWGASKRVFLGGLAAWDRSRLLATLRRLAALDRALKSSRLSERLLLEQFVLETTA